MATFSFPKDFAEHRAYVTLLKKALLVVKPGTQKKFLYYKQYPFGAKKLDLVLVDFDLNCTTVLSKSGFKPTAEGMVSLTSEEELNFQTNKGALNRARLKKYIASMGSGFKPVFVPQGETDDEADGEVAVVDGQPAPAPPPVAPAPAPVPPVSPALPPSPQNPSAQGQAAPAQPRTLPTRPAPPQTPPPAPQPQASPSAPGRMERKMEFEENQFKVRQRIDELRKKAAPSGLEQLKNSALTKAGELAASGKFPEATLLLNQLATKMAAPPAPAPEPKAPAPSPKLSTYMNATRDWKAAKTTASNQVFALKTAILKACDKELEGAVKAKINQLNSILDVMDDAIITKIQEAGGEADEERQAERNRALVQMAGKMMNSLRSHPFAAVADENPFGSFTIRAPIEAVLTKITTDFAN